MRGSHSRKCVHVGCAHINRRISPSEIARMSTEFKQIYCVAPLCHVIILSFSSLVEILIF